MRVFERRHFQGRAGQLDGRIQLLGKTERLAGRDRLVQGLQLLKSFFGAGDGLFRIAFGVATQNRAGTKEWAQRRQVILGLAAQQIGHRSRQLAKCQDPLRREFFGHIRARFSPLGSRLILHQEGMPNH